MITIYPKTWTLFDRVYNTVCAVGVVFLVALSICVAIT